MGLIQLLSYNIFNMGRFWSSNK